MKKILTITFLCCFSLLSYAQTFIVPNSESQNIKYQVLKGDDNKVSVIKNTEEYNSYTKIVIPENVEYKGKTYTVTEIGKKAFKECENIKSISLPNTIETLNDDAFQNIEFEEFILPRDLKTIQPDAFAWTRISGYKLSQYLGKSYSSNCYEGNYRIYRWRKGHDSSNNYYDFIDDKTGKIVSDTLINNSLYSYVDDRLKYFEGKTYSNPLLKGTFSVLKFDLEKNVFVFSNNPVGYTINVSFKDLPSASIIEAKLKDEMEAAVFRCFRPKLVNVLRTKNPEYRYSGVHEVTNDSTNIYSIQDDYINADIILSYRYDYLGYRIKNVTDNTIKIIWNEATYVDWNGNSSALVTGNTRLIDSSREIKSAVLISGASTHGFMYPNDRIGSFDLKPLFPSHDTSIVDKLISIMIPIQINDVVNEYIFQFKILYDDTIGNRNI